MLAEQWGHIWKTLHKAGAVPDEGTRQPLWSLIGRWDSNLKEAREGIRAPVSGRRNVFGHSPPWDVLKSPSLYT